MSTRHRRHLSLFHHVLKLPLVAGLAVLLTLSMGCKSKVAVAPDYSRPLPPGQSALRKLPLEQWPELERAFQAQPGDLSSALAKSHKWFDLPSTKQFFPAPAVGISHQHAQASVLAFWETASGSKSANEFDLKVKELFDEWDPCPNAFVVLPPHAKHAADLYRG